MSEQVKQAWNEQAQAARISQRWDELTLALGMEVPLQFRALKCKLAFVVVLVAISDVLLVLVVSGSPAIVKLGFAWAYVTIRYHLYDVAKRVLG